LNYVWLIRDSGADNIRKQPWLRISKGITCVSFSELENDTLNKAELNEIKINETN
jgi:hypothetical protein